MKTQREQQSQQSKKLGKRGEQLAKKRLLNKGLTFIQSNFNTRFGEIDLIFVDQKTLVFVEVKTRNSLRWGYPENSINKSKLKKIKKTAKIFITENPQYEDFLLRIDVIAIVLHHKDIKYFNHHINIY